MVSIKIDIVIYGIIQRNISLKEIEVDDDHVPWFPLNFD